MTSPARAPRPTPRRQPVVDHPRPDLRVVGPPTRAAHRHSAAAAAARGSPCCSWPPRPTPWWVLGQVHLDEVGRQVRAERQLLAKEKVRLANDQSPARITR